MTQPNENTGTDMVLTPRQAKLQAVRDDLAPGAKPMAIIPRNFIEAQQMCQALASASLVPKAYRDKPMDMLLVVMTGSELGIPPMAALRLFTTWDGVPRLMAEGVRAVMLMSSDIEYFEMATCDEKHATWIGKRRGRPEKSITWTMERAKRAELTSKENWRKYQEAMLNARASMDLGRILAPDIIAGMRSLEEAQDGDFVEASAVEVKRTEFTAPPAPGHSAGLGTVTVTPTSAVIDPGPGDAFGVVPPRRGPGRPPKEKPVEAAAAERPTSPSADTSAAAPGPSPANSSTARPDLGEPAGGTKFNAAVESTRAADAARTLPPDAVLDQWGQPIALPTPAASPTAPSPSTESAAASPAENGAADMFGEDPVDADPPVAGDVLAEYYAWVAGCKTHRDLAAGLKKWKEWSVAKSAGGDTSFRKDGENTAKMSKAYSTRKSEVPA